MSLRWLKFVSALFIIFFAMALTSQNMTVGGVFPTINHSGSLNDKLDYSLYYFAAIPVVSFNKSNIDPYFNLFYSEQALSYKLSNKFSVTGSYVYQRSNVFDNNYSNENRFYIQAKYKHSVKKVNLTHRLRFDGRFIHNRITNETPFTHRARYLIGVDIPINETVYFTAYEEAFFNTFKNATIVYGENWAYAGIGKKLNKRNKIELGVLYITWNIGDNKWFNQYYLQASWITHLNFTKTKS